MDLPGAGRAVGAPVRDGPGIGGIGIDSRSIAPGDLFVALPGNPGPRFTATTVSERDGHDFAADAVAKGAAAVLVHRQGDYGAPALLVEDTLDALWDIGRAARRRLRGPVVAVTGSSGKTTFKSFAAHVLGAFATTGSLNNHIGVPLSLARTPADADGAVYEIGTNHPGEIEPLARLAAPDVAVLLNVHPAHIENFGNIEAIRREKISIANGLGGEGVFVHPVEIEPGVAGGTLSFGTAPSADVRLVDVSAKTARVATPAGVVDAPVPGGGVHRAHSVCALATALTALGLPLDRLHRLEEMDVPKGRGNRTEVAGVTVIDESYNANPASMAATLAAFATEPGRLLAILGDMRELGPGSNRYHAELAPHCSGLAGVFCVGDAMRSLYDALPAAQRLGWTEIADPALAARCAERVGAGDRILVKGSNTVFWTNGFVVALLDQLRRRRSSRTD